MAFLRQSCVTYCVGDMDDETIDDLSSQYPGIKIERGCRSSGCSVIIPLSLDVASRQELIDFLNTKLRTF